MRRSRKIVAFLERRMFRLGIGWLVFAGLAGALRVAFPPQPFGSIENALPAIAGYTLVAFTPIGAYLLARSAFPRNYPRKQPRLRLAFPGKWRLLDRPTARKHHAYGPIGIVVSLLIGLLLNVVMRAGEYYLAIPAMSAQSPEWSQTLFWVMTGDLVVMSFLYIVAFVMALRTIPLFPRMMILVWVFDVMTQMAIASVMFALADLPPEVAGALAEILEGNVQKTLISVAVWLPYLILSKRINVTYRHRIEED